MKTYKLVQYGSKKTIGFMINDVCSLKCTNCIVGDMLNDRNDRTLSYPLIDRVLEFGKHISANRYFVSGGEPFETPDALSYFLEKTRGDDVYIGTNGLSTRRIEHALQQFDNVKLSVTLHHYAMSTDRLRRVVSLIMRNRARVGNVNVNIEYGAKKLPDKIQRFVSILSNMHIQVKCVPLFTDTITFDQDIETHRRFAFDSGIKAVIDGNECDANRLYDYGNEVHGINCDTTNEYFFDYAGNTAECGYTRANKKNIFTDSFDDIVRTQPNKCSMKYCSTSMVFANKWYD